MWRTLLIVGWAFFISQVAFSFPATFGIAPDNSRDLLLETLNSAKTHLSINIYEFNDPVIEQALVQKMKEGVAVDLLVESLPWALKPEGAAILNELKDAMKREHSSRNHLFLMIKPTGNKERRFKLDHAKYAVIDSQKTWISSENFAVNAMPKSGYYGNRGWQVVLEDPTLAHELESVFKSDSSLKYGDVEEASGAKTQIETKALSAPSSHQDAGGEVRHVREFPTKEGDVSGAKLILSPDSLDSVLKVIRMAKRHLEIEFLSLPSIWKEPTEEQNPVVKELIAAAERGVNIRVLLNDESAFKSGTNSQHDQQWMNATDGKRAPLFPNEITVETLNQVAHCKHLPLSAKIVSIKDVEITYVHNKGILVDDSYALVSSINGTRDSMMNNREASVLLKSTDAARYFGQAFEFDWENSPNFPDHNSRCKTNQ